MAVCELGYSVVYGTETFLLRQMRRGSGSQNGISFGCLRNVR